MSSPPDYLDAMYQASVFLSPCKRWVADPHHGHKAHCWVTVYFPDFMSYKTHTDSEVMSYVYQRITDGQVTFATQALHSLGQRCMSLPILWEKEDPQSEAEILFQAKRLAAWWVHFIRGNKANIDQRMVFEYQEPPTVNERSLREIPLAWEQPLYAGW
jgi:hypothetical protein